ncbi:CDP-glycerol glycerophosphotransferase family protein [Dialister sp.]|uniref:CDP-glycerol glycerophosphotransferase family protein n=1 Tax=Dialister sp. TaxID=1955814 RepID=UPI003EFF79BB
MPKYKFHIRKKFKAYLKLYSRFSSLRKNNIKLSPEKLSRINYQDLYQLHYILNYDQYNRIMHQLENINAEYLRKKDKIKISFVLLDSAMWCGDELYKMFSMNPRYEVNVLLCEPKYALAPSAKMNFYSGVEKLKQFGINVKIVRFNDDFYPSADILFFLTPYFKDINKGLSLRNLPLTKLIAFIDYGLYTSDWGIKGDFSIRYVEWREFVDTKCRRDDIIRFLYRKGDGIVYTGYPRMDIFYRDQETRYQWKTVNPAAKKIIWAPHWSIDSGIKFATFQKNYKWFYEYAKTHPETTSWVVKPHPELMNSAVKTGIFKNDEEYRNYMNAWNSLPNAKVETGAYYQDIFKTSDAMILDSGSFTSEYVYTHKPELFLTRKTDKFSTIGRAIINAIYTADGSDFRRIQDFIENVVIKGQDPRKNACEQVFRKYLDYYTDLGKLASENIYNVFFNEFEYRKY